MFERILNILIEYWQMVAKQRTFSLDWKNSLRHDQRGHYKWRLHAYAMYTYYPISLASTCDVAPESTWAWTQPILHHRLTFLCRLHTPSKTKTINFWYWTQKQRDQRRKKNNIDKPSTTNTWLNPLRDFNHTTNICAYTANCVFILPKTQNESLVTIACFWGPLLPCCIAQSCGVPIEVGYFQNISSTISWIRDLQLFALKQHWITVMSIENVHILCSVDCFEQQFTFFLVNWPFSKMRINFC